MDDEEEASLSYQNHYCAFMVLKPTSFNAVYANKHVIRIIKGGKIYQK